MSKNLINFNMSVHFTPLELLIDGDGESADIRESIEESLAQGNPAVEYIGTQLRNLCDELVLDTEAVVDAYENASIDDVIKYVSFDAEAITYTGAEGDYVSFNVPCTFDADTFITRATTKELANAGYKTLPEEFREETESRANRNLFPVYREPEDIIASKDEDNYVEGYVQLHISDMIDNDHEAFLDILSEALVGSPLLMDVNYDVVGMASEPNTLIFKVTGDVSDVLRSEDE